MRRRLHNDHPRQLEGCGVRLEGLTIADDALAALDDETVAALIGFRYGQLLDAGFGLVDALVLAARTDRSLESILSQHRYGVGAAA
jgi:hypothetical protein